MDIRKTAQNLNVRNLTICATEQVIIGPYGYELASPKNIDVVNKRQENYNRNEISQVGLTTPNQLGLNEELVTIKEDQSLIDTTIAKCLTKVAPEKLDSVFTKVIKNTLKTRKTIATAVNKIESAKVKTDGIKEEPRNRYLDEVKCGLCQKLFTSSRGLAVHTRKHCSVIVQAGIEKTNLVQQYLSIEIDNNAVDADGKPPPVECEIKFEAKSDTPNCYLNETITVEPLVLPQTLKCEICNKCFKRPGFYAKHLADHKVDKCGSCHNFIKKCSCNDSRQFKCDKCEKSFQKSGSLKKHEKYCSRGLNECGFQCNTCHKAYKSRSVLIRHLLIHSEEKHHKCESCEKTFAQAAALKRHSFIHNKEKPFTCNICSKNFGYSLALKRHILTHSDKKPVKTVIKHRFSGTAKKIHLNNNQTKCSKKPFQCLNCSKSYFKLTFLKKHILTHSGIKPYECDHCHKKFSERSNLIAHLRRHDGFKRYSDTYKCMVCDKVYRHPSALATHVRKHTGAQPFKCDVCHKRFAYRSLLLIHNKSHELARPLKCDLCDKSFKHGSQLTKHMNRKHRKNTELVSASFFLSS